MLVFWIIVAIGSVCTIYGLYCMSIAEDEYMKYMSSLIREEREALRLEKSSSVELNDA